MNQGAAVLQLFGKASSINVRKVLWLCAELEEPFELHVLGREDPNLLALNPNAQVPVIQDGEVVLWESNSICRYLAGRAGRRDLLPAEPEPRARVEQWMDWQATDLNSAWRYVFMARVRQHPDYKDEASISRSEREWNTKMDILDRQLRKTGAFVAGDQFSLADIVIALSVNRWRLTPQDVRPDFPTVAAYSERLAQRDGFHRYCANGIP